MPSKPSHLCSHEQTTAPDDQGYVICCDCLAAVHRPLTQDEINNQIKTS